MGTVTFSFATWTAGYPEFSACTPAQGQAWFDTASLYFRNDSLNPADAAGTLSALLYMLTSHVAWLRTPRDANGNPAATGQAPSPLVGRITNASEGSVSVATENKFPDGAPQWYQQTPYGAAFWAATAPYRTMRYGANPTIVPGARYPNPFLPFTYRRF